MSSFLKSAVTFIISMSPVLELRAGIPFGIQSGLSWQMALLWSFLGNSFAVLIILLLLDSVSKFLRKHFEIFEKFFTWIFDRTRVKHTQSFEIWGSIALILFVAVPLPGTGGWTGALVAYVFGIKAKKAFPLIALGVLIAGLIMTIGWTGIKYLVSSI